MSGHRRPAAVAAALLLVLAPASPAFAATPQKIYRDLADNGKLDGTYTAAEIERAFTLPSVIGMDPQGLPRRPIRVPASAEAGSTASPAATRSERRVPFSGLDAALLVAVAGPLLLIGAGLRRRFGTPHGAQAVRG